MTNERLLDVKFNPRRNILASEFDVEGRERRQLMLIDVETRDHWRISLGDDVIHQLGTWSRDGRYLAFSSNARNGVDFDVYLYDLGACQ
jgi:Tol biopolymer transport system component